VATVVVAVSLIACSGEDGDPTTPTAPDPADTSGTPIDLPASEGFILYRDGLGDIVAFDTESGDSHVRSVDPTSEVILGAECTTDGSRIAYLRQDFSQTSRELLIEGAGDEQRFSLPPGTQGITWSPDASRLAYVTFAPTEGYTLSTLDFGSGASTEQTRGFGIAGGPRWSPTGTHIAYQAQSGTSTEIWLYEVDSSADRPTQITDRTGVFDPEWSPDGRHLIASAIADDGSFQIFEVDPGTGQATSITSSTDIYKRLPRYSADGETIAYTGSIVAPTVSRSARSLHSFGVFLMSSDGSDERALTADPRLNPGQGVDTYLDAVLIGWCTPGEWLDATWTLREVEPSPAIQ
jgi:Tol biopolymer transport system component